MRFKQRMKLREIAERYGTTAERMGHLIGRVLDGESNRKSPVTQYYTRSLGDAARPSVEALFDRDQRVNAPRTPNMIVLGDPETPRWKSNAAP
jgi:hypothetical protein